MEAHVGEAFIADVESIKTFYFKSANQMFLLEPASHAVRIFYGHLTQASQLFIGHQFKSETNLNYFFSKENLIASCVPESPFLMLMCFKSFFF